MSCASSQDGIKHQDCTLLGQIPLSKMLKAGGNVLEWGKISSKWECFFLFFPYYQDSGEGRNWVESIVSGVKALRALDPKWQTVSSSLTALVSTGLPLVGHTGRKRHDGFGGEPNTFLAWEGGWNSHWTSLSLDHLQNQNSCRATQSSHQWHPSAEPTKAYRLHIDTWSVDNSALLVKACCCMPWSPQCLPTI